MENILVVLAAIFASSQKQPPPISHETTNQFINGFGDLVFLKDMLQGELRVLM